MNFTLGKFFLIIQSITLFLIFLDFKYSEYNFFVEDPSLLFLPFFYALMFLFGEGYYLKINTYLPRLKRIKISKNFF